MKRHRGVSLIDLLIGLFVGLLVALAVYSTAVFTEAQRRTSGGSNSTLESAMNGLYAIQHDVKAAGIGVWLNGKTHCPSMKMNIYKSGSVLANGALVAPVIINAGASDAVSDSITIAASTSVLGNNGILLTKDMATAEGALTVPNVHGIAVNDMILVAPESDGGIPCTMMQVTEVTQTSVAPSPPRFDIAHSSSQWNPASLTSTFTNAPAYAAGSLVLDIDQFSWLTDRVRNRQLESVNLLTGTTEVLAENIVMLKAYYGTTNGATPQIEQWVPATEAWANPLDAAHVAAIRAVRVVVVARSQHPEKPTVFGGACDATTAAPASWPDGPTIDLTGEADWQCYKYRTMSLVVPLKNVIFGAGST